MNPSGKIIPRFSCSLCRRKFGAGAEPGGELLEIVLGALKLDIPSVVVVTRTSCSRQKNYLFSSSPSDEE
jgi:hypothetical protein